RGRNFTLRVQAQHRARHAGRLAGSAASLCFSGHGGSVGSPAAAEVVMQVSSIPSGTETILTEDALALVEALQRRFDPERKRLLARRQERQRQLDAGVPFQFLDETAAVRGGSWQVAPTPADLAKRWVEITGPVERK